MRTTFAAGLFALGLAGCGGQPSPGPAVAPKIAGAPEPGPAGKDAPAIERKVISKGKVEVVVPDVDAASAELEKLTLAAKGYVAKSDVSATVRTRRTARFTLKVPSERYREVLAAVAKLGVLERSSTESEDVTEEFVDIDARVKTMKAEEEALNKMLASAPGKIEDVLKMRSHIADNRANIERAEGRLKYLTSVTSFATLEAALREDETYQPEEPPTVATRADKTFREPLTALKAVLTGVLLFVIAVAPWLIVIAVVAGGGRFAWKLVRPRPPAVSTAGSPPA